MKEKKLSSELMRLKTVIEADRLNVSGNFDELIISDISKLLNDYFDLKVEPSLSIIKEGSLYRIGIEAKAVRIKTFGTLPR